ncbi:N-acyl-L-homoserine lactone synthetase [Sphingomonas zeicaulis]|uniref:acyl-homoserine-lactone synthase n=1 Tax=Sphingomonas zeicaulis TaxID=1632740 RepID=UPI003D1FF165
MIHVIQGASNPAGRVLPAMFEARKAVFVDLLGWDVPVINDRFEVDQFDDARAVYIVVTDDEGRHRASARLLETTKPHILDTLFPDLSDMPPPRGETVREITRFCLDRDLTAAERRSARNELVLAFAYHAQEVGITTYTGVADLNWFRQIVDFGWRCQPLGTPKQHGSTRLTAMAISIDADTLRLLGEAGISVRCPVRLSAIAA